MEQDKKPSGGIVEEVPKILKHMTKKAGAIIMVGGMVYFLPEMAIASVIIAPVFALRAVGQTVVNVGEVALDLAKFTAVLAQGILYQVVDVGGYLVGLLCPSNTEESVEPNENIV